MAHPYSFSSAASAEMEPGVPPPKTETGASATARDSEHVIAGLRTSISNGDWTTELVLQRIAEAAQILTQADGAAIALRQEDVVICKARAGDLAPALGTSLDTSSGISGECLRTATCLCCEDTNSDARVDGEVCRQLGLRSLAVVSLGTKAPAQGILEAFSSVPHSFPEQHLELLQDLAELVMAVQRRTAEADNERSLRPGGQAISAQFEATSNRLLVRMRHLLQKNGETLVQASRTQSGRKKLGVIGMSAIALSLGLGWLVGHAAPPKTPPIQQTNLAARSLQPSPTRASGALMGSANPGSTTATRSAKPSPSSPVVLATKTEKISTANDVYVRNVKPERKSEPSAQPDVPAARATPIIDSEDAPDTPVLADTPEIAENRLGSVLSLPTSLPQPALPISAGLTQGVLVHRVQPLYPPQARTLRLGGTVVLHAVVEEDGTVHDLSLVSGHPVLAHAAISAVRQWRYRPFRLNGKPVAMRTEIRVDFKLPSD